MKRKVVCLVVASLLVLAAAGCGSSGADPDAILGTWVHESGMDMVFRDDGTFSKAWEESQVETNPWEHGTYTFDGEILSVTPAEDSYDCAGIEGSYRLELSDDGTSIATTVIDDDCGGRADGWDNGILYRTQ